ncbi:MAG: Na+/H+ antiporter [Candidatus Eremiobacteraeota bacterium]|nr:Na+/H+ antiporter [Candidatus Eremiobacteraeota bacterium]
MLGGWLIFGFLVATAVLAVLSKRLGVAYPIVFVVAGSLLGFVPNLPAIQLDPDLIFLIVLPIFLFGAGWTTDWSDFKRNRRPIGLLAVGLVVFTTCVVAALAHGVIPGMAWPAAFALGAIVAPTDSIAAEAIADGIAFPRRLLTIITGESLVNDAAALTIYQFAIAAAVTGTFVARTVVPQFVFVAIGGVMIGLIVGSAVQLMLEKLRARDLVDEVLTNVILLFAPFASYLPALALGVSGVLAAVTAGIYLSRQAPKLLTPDSRIIGYGIWEMLTYLLNAFVFLLLGLQLRGVVGVVGRAAIGPLLTWGIVISIAAIVLRFVWVFPATYLPRMLSRTLRERDPYPPWQYPFIISWSGMRGIVSLTAALALPVTVAGGAHFPRREETIFITFCVIFATLVAMGLSLPLVVRALGVLEDGKMEKKEIEIRIRALEQGLQRLRELEPTFDSEVEWEVEGRIVDEYQHRIEHLSGHLDGAANPQAASEDSVDHRLQEEALNAERTAIQAMRTSGEIPDEIYRNIEFDLDLADARLRAG